MVKTGLYFDRKLSIGFWACRDGQSNCHLVIKMFLRERENVGKADPTIPQCRCGIVWLLAHLA